MLRGIDCTKTVITSHEKTATAPLPPLRSVKVLDQLRERIRYLHYSYQPNRLMSTGSCLHPFPRCASPGNLGQQRSRGISVLAGERAQGFGLHASSGIIGGLAVLLRQRARICPGFRRSEDLAVALAGGADRMKWFASSVFLEGEHRLFAQLLYGTGMRISEVCNCGSRIWISGSRHDHRAEGRAPRIGP